MQCMRGGCGAMLEVVVMRVVCIANSSIVMRLGQSVNHLLAFQVDEVLLH
jgi:hypothetical protein